MNQQLKSQQSISKAIRDKLKDKFTELSQHKTLLASADTIYGYVHHLAERKAKYESERFSFRE